jgi:hypothetical protein
MELLFKTTNPSKLKADIFKLIDEEKLVTWRKFIDKEDNEEEYLIHAQQWGKKGAIELEVNDLEKHLIARVLKFEDVEENKKDFEGYYLGRFCEIIFVNFPKSFSTIDNR